MRDGINIVGTLSGAVGTVVAANMVVEALRRGGVPLAAYDTVTDTHGRSNLVRPPIPFVNKIEDLPYSHSLFLDVIPAVHRVLTEHTAFFRTQRRAMAFYYELAVIPLDWRPLLDSFDVLFAPSCFVQDAIHASIKRSAPLMPVVPLIERPALARTSEDRRFRVLYSFDPLSAEDRKNPMAGLLAFSLAFAERTDVELILKVWRTHKLGCTIDLEALKHSIHPNIYLLENDLTYEDNLALTASADCYLSLHRGEGLGLALLESMALGTRVIATDYGGSRDFLDDTSGIPVPYTLIPTDTHHQLFTAEMLGEQGVWADADVGYAAGGLRWLAENRLASEVLGQHARARYIQRREEFLSLRWLEPFFGFTKARTTIFTIDPSSLTSISRQGRQ